MTWKVAFRCSNRTQSEKIKVVVYADDIAIFVTRPEQFNAIHQFIGQYERALGACLNPAKSKALAIWSWTLPARHLNTAFHPSLKILGIIFAAITEISETHSWRNIVQLVWETGETYIHAKIMSGTTCTIRKYIPTGKAMVHRTNLATKSTLCSANCNDMQVVNVARCHLPGTSSYPPSTENKGRLGLIHLAPKCRTTLLHWMRILSRKTGTIPETWTQHRRLKDTVEYPPHKNRIKCNLNYLRNYATDMA
jgi:hypothetical protein